MRIWASLSCLILLSTVPLAHAETPASQAPSEETTLTWATRAAAELVRRAESLEQRGDVGRALSRYHEAIRMDSTFGEAYLGLGRLRERIGDTREAERVYSRAAQLAKTAPAAFAQRAFLRHRVGRIEEALRDLEHSVALETTHAGRNLRLADWYAAIRAWPAALAVWRRIASQPGADVAQARLKIRALMLLAAATDPVSNGVTDDNWVRRSLATIALTPQ